MSIEQLDFEKEPKTRAVNSELSEVSHKVSRGIKKVSSGVSGLLKKKYKSAEGNQSEETTDSGANILSQIEGLSKLKDMQVITQEEFEQKKRELLARL